MLGAPKKSIKKVCLRWFWKKSRHKQDISLKDLRIPIFYSLFLNFIKLYGFFEANV